MLLTLKVATVVESKAAGETNATVQQPGLEQDDKESVEVSWRNRPMAWKQKTKSNLAKGVLRLRPVLRLGYKCRRQQ